MTIPAEITEPEAQAAYIIAETLSVELLHAIESKRTFLYSWEEDAIRWLRAWQERTGGGMINWWTASYLRGEISGAAALRADELR